MAESGLQESVKCIYAANAVVHNMTSSTWLMRSIKTRVASQESEWWQSISVLCQLVHTSIMTGMT